MKCVSCEKPRKEVLALIKLSDAGYICTQCIETLQTKAQSAKALKRAKDAGSNKIPSIKSMVGYLDKFIIGQDEVKKTISVAVRNHFKRLSLDETERKNITKANVLLIGASGTGKTELVKRLAEFVSVPMVVVDATTYTSAGYIGEDVDAMVAKLYEASGNDKEKTQRGIIFIDEIDKKRKDPAPNGKDVAGSDVQKALLKLVEGRDVTVNKVSINTSNILFISAGAFVGLDRIIEERVNSSSIGFGEQRSKKDLVHEVTNDDLFKFGMIPELVGRFPITTSTNPLSKEELKLVITQPKTSVYRQYITLFGIDGVELSISESIIDQIVDRVFSDKIGVRAIQKQFDELLKELQYALEDDVAEGVYKIALTTTQSGAVACKKFKRKQKQEA